MHSRRQVLLELLAGILLVTSSNFTMAESGSGSSGSGGSNSGSGSSNSGSGNNNDDGDDRDNDDGDDDQDEARSAVKSGDATALRGILLKIKEKYSGEIVHVGLKRRSQRLVYMIKIIDPAGKLLLVRVDAKSGVILGEHGI